MKFYISIYVTHIWDSLVNLGQFKETIHLNGMQI